MPNTSVSAMPLKEPAGTATILTLGCKVNQFESAAMTRLLVQAGYRIVSKAKPADLTLINTCTVTHRADWETRALIRRAHRLNPEGKIVVTGCLAQLRPEQVADLDGVVLVFGQDLKTDFVDLIPQSSGGPARMEVSRPGQGGRILNLGFPEFDRTRAFFRIQDGCSAACAYCTVPRARGPSRSLEPESVMQGLAYYFEAGYQEVVLTGIHLGAWGRDLDPVRNFAGLLERLAGENFQGRVRISSLEPNELTDEVIQVLAGDSRFCPHLHLPLQSGDRAILKAMGRPYDPVFFKELVRELTDRIPDLCLGADVLVGFPGEDEKAFRATEALLSELPLAYLHVFPFSPRPRTLAATWPNQVASGEAKARVARLRELSLVKRDGFRKTFIGRIRPTLVETTRDRASGLRRGLTDNYLKVLIQPPDPPVNRIVSVCLLEVAGEDGLLGKMVSEVHG